MLNDCNDGECNDIRNDIRNDIGMFGIRKVRRWKAQWRSLLFESIFAGERFND